MHSWRRQWFVRARSNLSFCSERCAKSSVSWALRASVWSKASLGEIAHRWWHGARDRAASMCDDIVHETCWWHHSFKTSLLTTTSTYSLLPVTSTTTYYTTLLLTTTAQHAMLSAGCLDMWWHRVRDQTAVVEFLGRSCSSGSSSG
jgi:hypothetical protein